MKPSSKEPGNMTSKMLLAANLYYKDKLSQQEIAKRMSISRPWVSKLLSRAEAEGIVRIEIDSSQIYKNGLEKELMDKYNLKHIEIVRSSKDIDAVAKAAAKYFLSVLQSNDTIGIGWGTSVSRLISHVAPDSSYPDVQVFPLAGSFGDESIFVPNISALHLSENLGASVHTLHMPAHCLSEDEYRIIRQNPETKKVLEHAEHSDILLLGIGVVQDSFSSRYGLFTQDDIRELYSHNVMGDVALQYFDTSGSPIQAEATKLLIKADIFAAAANAHTTIGIANGIHKTKMIHVALKNHLINSFFTDEETALSILSV